MLRENRREELNEAKKSKQHEKRDHRKNGHPKLKSEFNRSNSNSSPRISSLYVFRCCAGVDGFVLRCQDLWCPLPKINFHPKAHTLTKNIPLVWTAVAEAFTANCSIDSFYVFDWTLMCLPAPLLILLAHFQCFYFLSGLWCWWWKIDKFMFHFTSSSLQMHHKKRAVKTALWNRLKNTTIFSSSLVRESIVVARAHIEHIFLHAVPSRGGRWPWWLKGSNYMKAGNQIFQSRNGHFTILLTHSSFTLLYHLMPMLTHLGRWCESAPLGQRLFSYSDLRHTVSSLVAFSLSLNPLYIFSLEIYSTLSNGSVWWLHFLHSYTHRTQIFSSYTRCDDYRVGLWPRYDDNNNDHHHHHLVMLVEEKMLIWDTTKQKNQQQSWKCLVHVI